jgi:hypothetical protein
MYDFRVYQFMVFKSSEIMLIKRSLLLLKWVALTSIIQIHVTHGHIYLAAWVHVVIIANTILLQGSGIDGIFQLSIGLFLYSLSVL